MSVGRRRVLLPFAFLGARRVLPRARALPVPNRPTNPHKLWNDKLTPEQIKAALANLSLGGER